MAGEIATAYVAIVPSMRDFGKQAVRQVGPQAREVGTKLGQQAGASFSSAAAKESGNWFAETAKGAIKNVALYGSMYAAIQAVQKGVGAVLESMIGFNAEIEQATVGFETLLGSSAAAKDEMQWIKDFAKETPFQYKDLVGYSQQLLALGFNAKQSQDVLQATGDAAAALGRGSDSIARINLALGQMWTKGKVQSQEMLQLTEAGIGAWQILADGYGTSVEKVQEAVTAGVIKAKDAVPILLEGMNARFGGLMEKQSQTFSGVLSNIQDTLQQQLAKAGEPLFKALEGQAKDFLAVLSDPQVVKTMGELGSNLASGVKILASGVRVAYKFRDVLLAVAAAYVGVKIASSFGEKVAAATARRAAAEAAVQAAIAKTLIAEKELAAARATSATAAVTANAAAAESETVVQAAVAKTTVSETQQAALLEKAAYEAVLTAKTRAEGEAIYQVALTKTTVAEIEALSVSTRRGRVAVTSAAVQVEAESAVQIALAKTAIAEEELAAAEAARKGGGIGGKLGGMASMAGQALGLAGLVDGYKRVGDAAKENDVNVVGFAESIAGGAIAGAAFGSVILPGIGTAIGAAAGALIGLTTSMWSYSQASQAANKDTTAVQQALQDLSVDAEVATASLNGVTNEQLQAAGGYGALLNALQAGKYSEYVADLKKQSADLHDQFTTQSEDLQQVTSDAYATNDQTTLLSDSYINQQGAVEALGIKMKNVDDLIVSLGKNSGAFAESQAEITANTYQAAYAADRQTGALGNMTEAAWVAVQAQGGLSYSAEAAAARMEGLGGVAGYVTHMLTGIPVNTPINFSTNASDILQKIIALQQAVGNNSNLMAATEGQRKKLEAAYKKTLTTPVKVTKLPTYGAPKRSGGGGGGGSKAKTKSKAQIAAEKAAAKLKKDRAAQKQFGEAFGAIMDAALEGDFDEYRDRLAEQIKSLTEDGYKKAAKVLKDNSKVLTQTAKDYAALTNKLKAATDAYDDLTKSMQDQYDASRDQILGLGQATDAQSFDQLAYLLGETTTKATEYQAVLAQLKAQGLSEDLWNQLAQAGPESAGLAESILAQGKSGIDQLNSLSAGLVGAANSMGDLVSQAMYKDGADAMKAYIDGLKSESEALEHQLATIANNVLKKTGIAITPGAHGYTVGATSDKPTSTVNTYNMTIAANSLGDLQSVKDFIAMLNQAPTTQLVNQAGTVTS